MKTRDLRATIEGLAANWVALEDRGKLSEQDAAALEHWLERDPRHLGAYARARAISAHFDRAGGLGSHSDSARIGKIGLPRAGWIGAAAAMAAAVVLVFVITMGTPGYQAYATEIGEIRRTPMKDGSAITLNTASAVKTRLTPTERSVVLMQGEAIFDVAADPGRPFAVHAADVTITAIGTSFTVRLRAENMVEVAVREGVVRVERAGAEPVLIAANSVLHWAPKAPPSTMRQTPEKIDRSVAWRQGMIHLDGLTLAEAAAEFARYGGTPIRLPQTQVAALKVTGLFSASDPAGFARAAALSLGLQARAQGASVEIIDPSR